MNPFNHSVKILGVGAPIVDVLAKVREDFLFGVSGAKGGMVEVTKAQQDEIIARIPTDLFKSAGGSAANTIYALSRLGAPTAFMGKMGSDENGTVFKNEFEAVDCDMSRVKISETEPTAVCLSLITPDAQRTMRTFLGASTTLSVDDISEADFVNMTHVHIEGYLLFNMPVMKKVLELAYDNECIVSMDMASHEVVRIHMDVLPQLLSKYVSIVFANDDEAKMFDPDCISWQEGYKRLCQLCPTVCVKLGAKGAVITCVDETVHVKALNVPNVLDTTAAGDLWAAGFLYAYTQNYPLAECGRCASIVASEVIKVIGTGASISEDTWSEIIALLP